MKIRLEEYCRGARVRLSVDDAPMTALHALVDHFVLACTDVEGKQKAEPNFGHDFVGAHYSLNEDGSMTTHRAGIVKVDPSEYADGIYTTPAGTAIRVESPEPVLAQPEEAPKKRGRPPKKVELAPEPVATEAQEEPGLPFDQTSTATSAPASSEEISQNTPTSVEPTGKPESVSTSASEPSPTTDPEITDSELQRYCAKLAQHFGTPQTVFDLAGKFVPEGAVARPTNIRDNSQRWAFVRAAEEQSGIRYHG